MNTAHTNNRRNTVIATAAVAVLVSLLLFLSPTDVWVKRQAASLVDTLIWDTWYRNTADWHGNHILLPAGKYRWIESATELVIVPREVGPRLIVSLSSTTGSTFDEKRFVTELCKEELRCKGVKFTQWSIEHTNASVVEYLSMADREQHEVYIRPSNASVLIHVVADQDVESDLIKNLIGVIVSQLKQESKPPTQ